MRRKTMAMLIVVLSVAVLGLWGCPKSADVTATPEEAPAETVVEPATTEAAPVETPEEPQEAAAAAAPALEAVYFDFDRSFIRNDAHATMTANADWLKANPQANIRIEGNCDERGTVEYNQALGQRRARSAKKYLTDLGIAASRISLISYGKEKPMCYESTEECWQQNRRADFVVQE